MVWSFGLKIVIATLLAISFLSCQSNKSAVSVSTVIPTQAFTLLSRETAEQKIKLQLQQSDLTGSLSDRTYRDSLFDSRGNLRQPLTLQTFLLKSPYNHSSTAVARQINKLQEARGLKPVDLGDARVQSARAQLMEK